MRIPNPRHVTWAIWVILTIATGYAAIERRWDVVFVTITALFLTVLPGIFVARYRIRLPMSFVAVLSVFVFFALFLGEVFDFYERYWWWDILLHGGSAVALGIIGFLFVFYLFEGDRYAAPPISVSVFAFCFAVTIGTGWEMFEYAADQFFGMNMQKSGLDDTMGDLIVNALGASIGAGSGFLFLKKRELGGLGGLISEFMRQNRRLFRKMDR